MSKVTNEGVMMRCKVVTANLLTVVGLLVEPSIAIAKPKGSIDASIYISQTTITVKSIIQLNIPPSLASSFSEVF